VARKYCRTVREIGSSEGTMETIKTFRPFRGLIDKLGLRPKENKTMDELSIYLCGLYKKKDKNGKEYLVGDMSDHVAMFIFPNRIKDGPDDPDYNVCLRERNTGGGRVEGDDPTQSEFPE